jgi:hypothetical protein
LLLPQQFVITSVPSGLKIPRLSAGRMVSKFGVVPIALIKNDNTTN